MNDGPSKNPTGLRTVVGRFDLLPREGDGGEPPRQAQGKEAEHSTGPAGCSCGRP